MAKHITKSVMEDIACEIKRLGIITKAYEDGHQTDEMISNFGTVDEFNTSGTATLDWFTESLIDILYEHDPSFDANRFREIAKYKYEY